MYQYVPIVYIFSDSDVNSISEFDEEKLAGLFSVYNMAEQKKEVIVKKPPIETASWCYRQAIMLTLPARLSLLTPAPLAMEF